MITPLVDTLCCGGISLLVVPLVLLYAWSRPEDQRYEFVAQDFLITSILINWPHFMASYRILYRKPQNAAKHPIVSYGLPILFVGIILYAVFTAGPSVGVEGGQAAQAASESRTWVNPRVLQVFEPLAPLLLAWHYTGQSWGMTASFAFLGGLRMTDRQRRLIRSGYHALLVYHVLWFINWQIGLRGMSSSAMAHWFEFALASWRVVLVVTFLLGLVGFRQLAQQSNKSIPIRCWLPWVATFSWYFLIDIYPYAFLFLQVFHALQYLIFPIRVEVNQYEAEHASSRRRLIAHAVLYYICLVGVGFVVFVTPQLLSYPGLALFAMISAAINVHHYFIDGVIWKIRNPEVRQSLFGHLSPAKE